MTLAIKTDEIYKLDVTDLSEAIANGDLTPAEVTEAFLARIAAVEDRVMAFCEPDFEGARKQAAILTAEAKAGKLRSVLHGIPFAIKDQFHAAGMLSPSDVSRPDSPQPEDCAVIEFLKEAGAVFLGKVYMSGGRDGKPVLSRNAWSLEHTPGGSSTGSGAAIGAREAAFTIGEQTAGSNLRPAMYNGVVGLKGTFGRVSRRGMVLLSYSMDHVGIMAPSVADTALIYSVLAKYDPLDPVSLDLPAPAPTVSMEGFRPPRIGLVREYFMETSAPYMVDATEQALAKLKAAGAEVTVVEMPKELRLTWYAQSILSLGERGAMTAQFVAPTLSGGMSRWDRGNGFSPAVGPFVPMAYYVQAQRIRRYVREQLNAIMTDQVDVLVTPPAPTQAPKAVDGVGDPSFETPWTNVGLPCIQVPTSLSPDGLPLGIQIIAPYQADDYLMQVAKWSEGVLGRMGLAPLA